MASDNSAATVVDMQMQPRTDGVLAMIERLATMPGFDPSNLEKLIDLHERTMATQARKAYYADFARMQQKLPDVYRTGRGHNSITYAKNHDIQTALRPVLFEFGFGISFRTSEADGKLRVVLVLAHREGHSEQSEFVIAADKTGNKNDIQAMGSAQTYAQRYLTLAMLNLTSTDDATDDDGHASQPKMSKPAKFDAFMDDLRAAADSGPAALAEAWKGTTKANRDYAQAMHRAELDTLKATAAKVAA